uniref:VIT domain-containing protein n=1 Tax=Sinocyclocheilus rhinocerous TaxID=307959 RepID=A0A673HYM1_9TELE
MLLLEVLVQDHVATVSSTLQYVNEEERPLEALFVFPLPADAAVCHFSAKIGEQEIVAEVQDRETARDRYDDAVSSGQQAFLLEESTESPDVFRLSVGCLSAGQNAAVTIIYVTELAVQADHSLRFCLPAVLNPRYTPAGTAAAVDTHFIRGEKLILTHSVCVCVFTLTLTGKALLGLICPSFISSSLTVTEFIGSLMRDPVVMISLYPKFPEEVMSSLASRGEFVFVIDRSGMTSTVCFSNPTNFLHVSVLQMLRASGAGSWICPFWYKLLLSLQLFVFTDGEVGNTKEVLDLVKSHTHSHRCFSLGIGEGASAALITGMAREGSGHAQFITDTDRMQPKVMQSLRFALQPAVLNISVDWTLPDDVTVDTLSPPINVLFQGQRTLIYAQLKGESSGGPEGTVTVKYSLKDQPVTNQLHFCLKPTEKTQLSIHRLVARTLIRSLEQKERSGAADVEGIRSRMVELSVQAGVSSVHTAFIAVNKDSRQTVKGPLLQRRVRTLPCHLAKDPLLQLVSLQKASGCWDLDATLADVFGKTEDELTNQKPAQVDGSVWATLLALIWLYGCKIEQQVEWQFVAMKAASWIGSQKGCVCLGNVLLGCQVTKETLGI